VLSPQAITLSYFQLDPAAQSYQSKTKRRAKKILGVIEFTDYKGSINTLCGVHRKDDLLDRVRELDRRTTEQTIKKEKGEGGGQ
jgi:hypothetical protein